jgi:hypothetical protein
MPRSTIKLLVEEVKFIAIAYTFPRRGNSSDWVDILNLKLPHLPRIMPSLWINVFSIKNTVVNWLE